MLKNLSIGIATLIFGFLVVSQVVSFENLNEYFLRETQSNIFQEIKILKNKNEDLKQEISELEANIDKLTNQNSALNVIEEEITKYKKLTGLYPVFGSGLVVTIEGDLTTPWIIDLINDFFNSGAEAVSVNGIRITNKTAGFDTLPQGQILLNGSILSAPYVFHVSGDGLHIDNTLKLTGGIFNRLELTFPEITITTEKKEIIKID